MPSHLDRPEPVSSFLVFFVHSPVHLHFVDPIGLRVLCRTARLYDLEINLASMQQPAEDPFDYISDTERGSLLIYERICPSAAPDPIMSRRVFDVGLDIGRIKGGIQRRQENKRTKSGRSASASEANRDDTSNNNRQLIPRMPRKKSNPNVRNTENQGSEPLPAPGATEPATIADDFPIPPPSPNVPHIPSETGTQTDMLPLSSPRNEEGVGLFRALSILFKLSLWFPLQAHVV